MPEPTFTFHSALRRMERGIEQKHIMDAITYGRVIESDGKAPATAPGLREPRLIVRVDKFVQPERF